MENWIIVKKSDNSFAYTYICDDNEGPISFGGPWGSSEYEHMKIPFGLTDKMVKVFEGSLVVDEIKKSNEIPSLVNSEKQKIRNHAEFLLQSIVSEYPPSQVKTFPDLKDQAKRWSGMVNADKDTLITNYESAVDEEFSLLIEKTPRANINPTRTEINSEVTKILSKAVQFGKIAGKISRVKSDAEDEIDNIVLSNPGDYDAIETAINGMVISWPTIP